MIVNPWTVSSLSLDIASVGLGLIATVGAVKQFRSATGRLPETGERLAEGEDRLYLLFWIGAVFLFLRFLAWPLFYFSLHSIIPEVAGAMCIFGTRNLQPVLTKVLELTKPLLFFTGLVWLLVFRLERFFYQSGSGTKARRSSLLLLSFCLLAGLVDSIGSAALWIRSNAELAVSCCTTITDIPSRFTVWIPTSLFGHEYQPLLWGLFFGSNILLICVALLLARRTATSEGKQISYFFLLSLALLNTIIGTFAFIEVIAPQLMNLPFHHCMYCMVQNVMDAPVFVALFIAGNGLLGAIYPVHLLATSWAEASHLNALTKKLLLMGVLFLSGNLLMITTHLFQ
jgi:hypothetical protein